MAKLVLKICTGTWSNASRDKRELSVCQEIGYNTLVLAKGGSNDCGIREFVDGFEVCRYSTRPFGDKIPKIINRVASLFTWAHYVRRMHPFAISGHDITGLLIGWISNLFRRYKAKLIYDSHEFEIGRNANRNKLQILWITHLERFLIKRCSFTIMVNDSIADEVQRIHKLKQRPIVVRSIPEKWDLKPNRSYELRESFLKKMPGVRFLLMYHGLVTTGRGVENAVRVASRFDDVGLVILGNFASEGYRLSLINLIAELNMQNKVLFHDAVPYHELCEFIGAVDVSTIILDVPGKSYYFSLPNKFFESIQSEVPVVSTKLPEIEKIINHYKIGLVCPVGDLNAATVCVEKLMNEPELYDKMKKNLVWAKDELCWENEKKVLADAYHKLITE